MNAVIAPAPPPNGRSQQRTHFFVVATLYSDCVSTPVRIRNMSSSGVMIEAAALPEVGCRVVLKRGSLHAAGHITWRVERRAGIKLEVPVCVADWMARQASPGQDRVDALIAEVRNAPQSAGIVLRAADCTSVEGELDLLRAQLIELGSSLIADVVVAASHPELQTIDIAIQRIDRISERLRGGG